MTDQLSPWSRGLLERSNIHLASKFHASYGNRSFITVLTKYNLPSLSWDLHQVHKSISLCPWGSILISCSHKQVLMVVSFLHVFFAISCASFMGWRVECNKDIEKYLAWIFIALWMCSNVLYCEFIWEGTLLSHLEDNLDCRQNMWGLL